MSLNQADHIITSLSKSDEFFSQTPVRCWQKSSGKINITIFAQMFADAEELHIGYKALRDHIAVSFQTREDLAPAERWNLYIFYFVSGSVPLALKQQIEQDKFSSRKMVYSDLEADITDEMLEQQINADLFDIDIPPRPVSTGTLEQMIATRFPLVDAALNKFGGADTYEILQPLLQILNA